MDYCSRCGASVTTTAPTRCTACGRPVFTDATPSASVILVDDHDRFLAVRRADEPGRGLWDIPGGFCGIEHPEVAAVRELREEVGLTVDLGPFVGMYLDRYEHHGVTSTTLNIYYLAWTSHGTVNIDPAEVSAVDWRCLDNVDGMAFAHQRQALSDARRMITEQTGRLHSPTAENR
ncbi:MAG TPA: NUDIX hydrolase [Candidatus Stackebrandtia excrementipullorum]|nr:NUDIX hydrolase [Candidatus Stackebrandtia excrementipullorum]